MAFAGLVVGWVVVGFIVGVVGSGPWTLVAGPAITALAALFYAKIGPGWARAADELASDGSEPEIPGAARFPRASLPRTVVIVALGIGVALLGSIVLGLILEAIELQVTEQSTVVEIADRAQKRGIGLEATMLAVSALILAPFAEEWLFRGLLFTRITARSGSALGYVLSAAGFAAIHGNPLGFVIYLWLGLVFAAVLSRTGRLGAAMAVHLGNNAYVLVLLFAGG